MPVNRSLFASRNILLIALASLSSVAEAGWLDQIVDISKVAVDIEKAGRISKVARSTSISTKIGASPHALGKALSSATVAEREQLYTQLLKNGVAKNDVLDLEKAVAPKEGVDWSRIEETLNPDAGKLAILTETQKRAGNAAVHKIASLGPDGKPVATKLPTTEKVEAEWVPTNQPQQRWGDAPGVTPRPVELPAFVTGPFERHGIVFGPTAEFPARFNPTAFVAKDPSGKEKVYMVVRGEKNTTGDWKRRSLPYLAESDDGIKFKMVQEKPLFDADSPWDKVGGIEDPRYADFRQQPVIAEDGKSFDGAIMYTAFDGKTARVASTLFNHNDLGGEFRKMGPIFQDADMAKNPLVPDNPGWNKSPAPLQYKDPKTGKIRNILYVGEGNQHHGGIMALESDSPLGWTWPESQKPVIKARAGEYDQNLVEPAFQPVIAKLPVDLAKKTGQTEGIYVSLHGDARPSGYQVGYRVFSLENPTGKPIFESTGPFLTPVEKFEIEGQVGKVVFASGSVEFKGRRFVYYGAADSYVGVASAPAAARSPTAAAAAEAVNK